MIYWNPFQSLDDLKRKRCLIIGVSGGLGSILAEILAENNAGVIDGIGNGTPNDLPLRKNLSYKDENYKIQLELDDYDLVFDAADGSAWVLTLLYSYRFFNSDIFI